MRYKPKECLIPNEISNKKTALLENAQINLFDQRLAELDKKSPIDLSYNEKVHPFIENYLGENKLLIARMQGLSSYYFSLFEQTLDKYGLPLELKYLPIVESALNPKAKSHSGATGLWQFMYLTGKQYGLNVSSYIDERQDPVKSTEAACVYLSKLYEIENLLKILERKYYAKIQEGGETQTVKIDKGENVYV